MGRFNSLAVLPALIAVLCVVAAGYLVFKHQNAQGHWIRTNAHRTKAPPRPTRHTVPLPPQPPLPTMTATCSKNSNDLKAAPREELRPTVTENHEIETKAWRYRVWSENRDHTLYPSASHYRITLPKLLRNVTGIAIHNATIPNTEYVVGPHNQHLDITDNGTTYEITLPQGNYTEGADFATALQTAIQAEGALGAYTVTYNTLTSTLTINSNGNAFSMLFGTGPNVDNSLWRQMGFLREDTAEATSHSSDGVIDLTGVKTVDVYIDELDCEMEGQPIASIDLSPGEPYTIYTLEPDDRRFFPVGKLNQITISLTTNHSKMVDGTPQPSQRLYESNGVDNNIWLEFYTLQYKNTLNDEIVLDPSS